MKTVNVLFIGCDNYYFKKGLADLLLQGLSKRFVRIFSSNLLNASVYIESADYIFINIRYNIHSLCMPFMLRRKCGSVIFGINGSQLSSAACVRDIINLNTNQSVIDIKKEIFMAKIKSGFGLSELPCGNCNYQYFTPAQVQFSRLFLSNTSVFRMSLIMNCSLKTVYSHKHNLKKKFSLKTDRELLNFLYLLDNEMHLSSKK